MTLIRAREKEDGMSIKGRGLVTKPFIGEEEAKRELK